MCGRNPRRPRPTCTSHVYICSLRERMVVLPPPTFFSWSLDISQQLSAHLDFVVRLPSMFDIDAFLFFADFIYCSALSRAMAALLKSVTIASLCLFIPRTSSHAK
jgi:hypothetical protein